MSAAAGLILLAAVSLASCRTSVNDIVIDQVLDIMHGKDSRTPTPVTCVFSCNDTAGDNSTLPSPTGCSNYGVQINKGNYEEIDKCCATHDNCYRQCNISKTFCDDNLKKCIGSHDSEIGQLFYLVVDFYGCERYQKAQRIGCDCPHDMEINV